MSILGLCVFSIVMIAICLAANSKGWLRRISVVVATIIGLPFVVVVVGLFLCYAVAEMKQSGVWPFKPLASYHAERSLKNGGTLIFDGIEKRSSGTEWNAPSEEEIGPQLSFTASYRPPDSDRVEQIASSVEGLFPSLEQTEVYFPGELIVVVPSGIAGIYVRTQGETSVKEWRPETPDGRPGGQVIHLYDRWRRLSLRCDQFYSIDIISNFDSAPKEDLLRIWNGLAEGDQNFSNPKIARFEPETRSLLVTFSSGRKNGQVSLQLSKDGKNLSLLEN